MALKYHGMGGRSWLSQDGPAGRALPLVAEVLVLDQGVALLAPGH